MCVKVPYSSRSEAQAAMHNALKSITRTKAIKSGRKPSAYKCQFCDGWHWGNHPTMKTYYEQRKRTNR
ncbi:hypothetical protein F406_gp027 [Agrobacterium phage 7-7-1]|uniref:Uncharacterized protein n=1 Tax=Agrobacterium phage 7-7-1 TaxID=1161931 RepID=J7FAR8_9CAUD|nr:hypothetical protein F406_gp027 [Agrobacterium phage 7-7-1]AFH19788.1 hypothetical protein 7-7-1_00090 [Agrobacterium phage 7-7-1]